MCYDYDSDSFISIPFVSYITPSNSLYSRHYVYVICKCILLVSYVGNSFGFAPLYCDINAHLKLIIVFAQVLYILTFPSCCTCIASTNDGTLKDANIQILLPLPVLQMWYRIDLLQISFGISFSYIVVLKFNSIHVNLIVNFYPKINFRVLFIWIFAMNKHNIYLQLGKYEMYQHSLLFVFEESFWIDKFIWFLDLFA